MKPTNSPNYGIYDLIGLVASVNCFLIALEEEDQPAIDRAIEYMRDDIAAIEGEKP